MTTKDPLIDLAVDVPFMPLKGRNTLLDGVFYDVGSLSTEELTQLSPLTDREGSVVVVPPSGRGTIRHYRDALSFMNAEGDEIRALAVAGVGSSVLGTAAFARNVADAIDSDVAGVVTGYGLTDLVAEALGGWFFFGALDRARMRLERLVETSRSTLGRALPAAVARRDLEPVRRLRRAPGFDVATVTEILRANPRKLDLVAGHSKGSLLLDYVLEELVRELDENEHELFDRLHIVTFGAVVDMPNQFQHVQQFLGSLDWFGGLNSRLSLPRRPVPHAWHHLNRRLPYHLDAVKTLQTYVNGTAPAPTTPGAITAVPVPRGVPPSTIPAEQSGAGGGPVDLNHEYARSRAGVARQQLDSASDALRDQVQGGFDDARKGVDTLAPTVRDSARQAEQVETDAREQAEEAQRQQRQQAGDQARKRYASLTKTELSDEAGKRGLPKSGTVDELVDRLVKDDTRNDGR